MSTIPSKYRVKLHGFTIVELLIVIVVIAILASITIVAYNGVQQRARDTVLADAAGTVSRAIQAFSATNGHFPRGGSGSTVAIGSGTECVDGSNGFFSAGVYTCTVEDTLVASGNLPTRFSSKLPKNTRFGLTSDYALMVYLAPTSSLGVVYYAMENPSAADTAHFNAQLTQCDIDPSGTIMQRDSWGMRNAICFSY